MRQRLILVGQVAGAHGVRGELRITTYTADPLSLIAYSPLCDEGGQSALTLTNGRAVKGGLVAVARGIATRERAQALRGFRLYVERAALPAPAPEEYYQADLIGLLARSPSGDVIGEVKSVADFGAGDLLEIAPSDGAASWWAPLTRESVPNIDLDEGWLVVTPPAVESP